MRAPSAAPARQAMLAWARCARLARGANAFVRRYPRGVRFARVAACIALAAVCSGELLWRTFRWYVGSPERELSSADWPYALVVEARDGRILGERASPAGLRGARTHLDGVSSRLVAATVASEDRRYFEHDGIDRVAIFRAALSNVRHLRLVSGGSTITSQLVKRVDYRGKPRPRTLGEKLVEWARAQNLEGTLDKKAILEAYFDHVDYGHGFAGPEVASLGYFGVAARDLSLAQSALLAVLPRAPTLLDPRRHLDRAVVRQRRLLHAMHAQGSVSGEDLARALAEPLVLQARPAPNLVAPHVVLAAVEARKHGAPLAPVRTTLDYDLQHDAEALALSHSSRLAERGARGVAIVVVDNATGEVLAEVGSADYFDASRGGAVDLVRRKRQAGSTLKPFVYAAAFASGLSPMAMLPDVPTEYGTTGALYAPDNFDGTFKGPISAREALAGSLNVPAVRVARDLGVARLHGVLMSVGLNLADGPKRYGLSLALGSAEVSPWSLAEAYATLARGGQHLGLVDRLPEGVAAPRVGEQVLDAQSTALVADALSDPLARVRGLHARGPFEFSYPVAVKTGTSTAYRDAWTAGFTRERTVVVWVGNPSGAPTAKLTGAAGAGPLFFDVMKRAMVDVSARDSLYDRELVEEADVCPLSGERVGLACPDHVTRKFARGRLPEKICRVHVHASARAGMEVPRPADLVCDPRGLLAAVALPDAFARFLAERPPGAPGADAHGLPWLLASVTPGCAAGGNAEVSVTLVAPRSGAVLRAVDARATSEILDVVADATGLGPGATLEVLVDGRILATLAPPYRGVVPIERGDHEIQVRPTDSRAPARLAFASISVR